MIKYQWIQNSYLRSMMVALIVIPVALLLIVNVLKLLGTEDILHLDRTLHDLLFPGRSETSSPILQYLLPLMLFMSAAGSFQGTLLLTIALCILLWILRKPRTYILAVGTSFASMWGLNTLLKYILQRERPPLDYLIEVTGYSFPSGHAMIATGFYGMLFGLWAIARRSRGKSIMLPVILGIMYSLITAISRIYLGVHYASDVIAGMLAGGLWLYIMLPPLYRRAARLA
ncbi:phosphatidylglycerophosphatase B [compost metagenome]